MFAELNNDKLSYSWPILTSSKLYIYIIYIYILVMQYDMIYDWTRFINYYEIIIYIYIYIYLFTVWHKKDNH